MSVTIQVRRDSAANWTSTNPVLHQGEQGYETDTGKMKIGDGSTAWASLGYFAGAGSFVAKSGDAMTGRLQPAVFALTDAATIAVNAALGNECTVTLTSGVGASRAMGVPSNGGPGTIVFWITQGASGGPYTVTWPSSAGGYDFGSQSTPVLSTAASAVDQVAFRWNAALGKYCFAGYALGF